MILNHQKIVNLVHYVYNKNIQRNGYIKKQIFPIVSSELKIKSEIASLLIVEMLTQRKRTCVGRDLVGMKIKLGID